MTVDNHESPWLASLVHLSSPVNITLDKLDKPSDKSGKTTMGRTQKKLEGNANYTCSLAIVFRVSLVSSETEWLEK